MLKCADRLEIYILSPPQKGGTAPPNFRPMSIVAKRLDGSRCHLVRR